MKIDEILKQQNNDGSFSIEKQNSTMYSAFILYLLTDKNGYQKEKQKITEFLLKEKSQNWTFNYWNHEMNDKSKQIPDDLFTTSLVYLALYKYNKEIFTPKDFAIITQTLTFLEENEGGPYKNWLVSPESEKQWLQTKYAGNLLLAQFLKKLDIDLENLNQYLNKNFDQKTEYISPGLIEFFQKNKVPKEKIYWQFPKNKKFIIAFKLENKKIETLKEKSFTDKRAEKIVVAVEKIIKKRLKKAGTNIYQAALPVLNKILNKEKNRWEILLLPYIFSQSFNDNFTDELLIDLGCANFYGWIAYTIYDDFLDDEGKKDQLSVANLALRELSQIFNKIENQYPQKNILKIFQTQMDIIDQANCWEVKNCRVNIQNNSFVLPKNLPNYHDFQHLHERSIGHGLGPLSLILIKEKNTFKEMETAIKSYIIAKQLNDDITDFWEDLERGQLNSVVTTVLQIWQKKYPQKNKIDLNEDKNLINEIFYNEIAEAILIRIIKEIEVSQNALQNFQEKDNPILQKLINDLALAAKKALKEKQDNKDFCEYFQN